MGNCFENMALFYFFLFYYSEFFRLFWHQRISGSSFCSQDMADTDFCDRRGVAGVEGMGYSSKLISISTIRWEVFRVFWLESWYIYSFLLSPQAEYHRCRVSHCWPNGNPSCDKYLIAQLSAWRFLEKASLLSMGSHLLFACAWHVEECHMFTFKGFLWHKQQGCLFVQKT